MHAGYEDILAVAQSAGIKPKWWDENGVPRFYTHHPRLCADIYADEVALIEIACQLCHQRMPVQMSWSSMDQVRLMIRIGNEKARETDWSLAGQVRRGVIHYGDPPHHDWRGQFCHAGCTMNVDDLRVLEFWTRDNDERDWARVAEIEIALPDEAEAP